MSGGTILVVEDEANIADLVELYLRKEFDLLRHLVERKGLALSRQQILDGVWGYGWYGDARTVDVHVGQVRKKLGDAVAITTVRGVGYRLDAPTPPR
jgi:two-component system, OmpR family, response regulator RegX3